MLAGCGGSAPPGRQGPVVPSPAQNPSPTAKPEPAAPAAPPASTADSDVEKNLAKLSPDDQSLARKQKTCPVTGNLLGSMGVPPKVVVKGRTVFLCCDGCEEDLKKEPEKYLKKIDDAQK